MSVGILFRCHNPEAPFIRSFIEYHQRMGVKSFCAIMFTGNQCDIADKVLKALGINRYIVNGPYTNLNVLPVSILDALDSEYVALIDVDEFLLPAHLDLVDKTGKDAYSFPWLLNVSLSIKNLSSNAKNFTLFPRGKQIIRKKSIVRLDEHSSILCPRCDVYPLRQASKFPILHYYARGFEDICLKMYAGGKSIQHNLARLQTIAYITKSLKFGRLINDGGICRVDLSLMQAILEQSGISNDMIRDVAQKLKESMELIDEFDVQLVSDVLKSYFDMQYEGIPIRKIPNVLLYSQKNKRSQSLDDTSNWGNQSSNSQYSESEGGQNTVRICCKEQLFDSLNFASIDDFYVSKVINASKISLRQSDFLPYALCAKSSKLMSVYTPKALINMPFLYKAQREYSTIARMESLDHLFRPKERQSITAKKLLFVLSIGRCGSTLVHKLFLAANHVSFSEPDILSQIQSLAPSFRVNAIKNIINLYLEWADQQYSKSNDVTFKLRAQQSWVYKVIHQAFPSAKFLFVKRCILPWIHSYTSAFNLSYENLVSILMDNYKAVEDMKRLEIAHQIIDYEALCVDPGIITGTIVSSELLAAIVSADSQEGLIKNRRNSSTESIARTIYQRLEVDLPDNVKLFYGI